MQIVAIICSSIMIPLLAVVGLQIVQFRQHINRGPQCARCPLYQTACAGILMDEVDNQEAKPLTLTPEMAV